ncbi:MAG: S-methyl-5-thioribose-1-phosphate isomerase [Armatimonadota bacterium]|nr:S-methyl-5-thioribose-1-phosphate isomerase [Armatimonadota bacterium]
MKVRPVAWHEGVVAVLDQTQLPERVVVEEFDDWRGVAEAIRAMKVRGAPAIGIAAAYGLALAARQIDAPTMDAFRAEFERVCQAFAQTRPTAVNLFGAIERMQRVVAHAQTPEEARARLLTEAQAIQQEDYEADLALARHGAALLPEGARVLTICNTGALATGGIGTALGIIRVAYAQGKLAHVYVCETRPRWQGLRLTAWELLQEGIPFEVIADGAAGLLMAQGNVDAVITGADRIAANGDTANKIGTYTLAVLAHYHGVPLYVAAPESTIDPTTPEGVHIPIEQRDPSEITHVGGVWVAPVGTPAYNPAFDITPASLISAIITEKGVYRPPYRFGETPATPSSAARS